MRVDAAFADVTEAEAFFEWLSNRVGGTGGPTGKVSYHLCSHALGEAATEPCTAAPDFRQAEG